MISVYKKRSPLSNHAYGRERDAEIIELVESWKVLTTDQLQLLFFPSIKSARKRLDTLYDLKKLQRCRLSIDQPNMYYVGRKVSQADHIVGTNWVRLYLLSTMNCFEKEKYWQYAKAIEAEPKILPDGFMHILDAAENKHRQYFIEFDLSIRNEFDKIPRYCELYENTKHEKMEWLPWWQIPKPRFPRLLIVTVDPKRKIQIERLAAQKSSNISIEVKLLDNIKKECVKRCQFLNAPLSCRL